MSDQLDEPSDKGAYCSHFSVARRICFSLLKFYSNIDKLVFLIKRRTSFCTSVDLEGERDSKLERA